MHALLAAIGNATMPPEARRVFHGRGGLFPGSEAWTLDAFPPVWVVTRFGPVTAEEQAALTDALRRRHDQTAPGEPLNAVLQTRFAGRSETTVLAGGVPDSHVVTEDNTFYRISLLRGQNHGLFLDMAEGRRWVRAHSRNAKVLNLFSYTCAFSVAAMQGGAREVVNVDMARAALVTGQQNHRINGFDSGARFLAHDLFNSWGKVARIGPYDLVIADPPSYQKGSFVANKDWPRLVRRLPDLMRPGAHALLCMNAPEIPEQFLRDLLAKEAPGLEVLQRLDNPAAFADMSPDRALKVLVARLPNLG